MRKYAPYIANLSAGGHVSVAVLHLHRVRPGDHCSAMPATATPSAISLSSGRFIIGIVLYRFYPHRSTSLPTRAAAVSVLHPLYPDLVPFGVAGDTGNKPGCVRPIGIQPTEVVKIIFVVTMAKHISYLKERAVSTVRPAWAHGVHFGILFVLISCHPGMGSALMLLCHHRGAAVMAGLRLYWFPSAPPHRRGLSVFGNTLNDRYRARILLPMTQHRPGQHRHQLAGQSEQDRPGLRPAHRHRPGQRHPDPVRGPLPEAHGLYFRRRR